MDTLRNFGSSMNSLVVFEVVAREKSITRAANELNVTQVAVSRMIVRLEKALGTQLFVRSRGGLVLTEDGLLLERGVNEGFGHIKRSVIDIKQRQQRTQTVTLSLSSAFIAYWLMPRYQRFQNAFPEIRLHFHVISGVLQGSADDADLALRPAEQRRKSQQGWTFTPEVVIPVCSAAYLESHGPLNHARDLPKHTLIELVPTTINWEDFQHRVGMVGTAPGDPLSFSDYALVLQTAMIGRGIALGWVSGVSYALRTGQLVPASRYVVATGRQYELISGQRPARPQVEQVREWLVAEMEEDLQEVARMYPVLAKPERL
jgi:LysR family transcriptional regulator, glycine cleavage system transcriptional activator